jgi:uncharacterized protein YdeI (YjbR/CyaY-like superfamily)
MNEALYFATEGELWEWYQYESPGVKEVWLGLYKKSTRIPSITIRNAMDAALCFGWSESKWQTVDSQRFCIRFTPRKPGIKWSAVASNRFAELERLGMIQASGQAAWDARKVVDSPAKPKGSRQK